MAEKSVGVSKGSSGGVSVEPIENEIEFLAKAHKVVSVNVDPSNHAVQRTPTAGAADR